MKTKTGLKAPGSLDISLVSIIIVIVIVYSILTSCSRKEDFEMQDIRDAAVSASKSLAKGIVFTVTPSGNYTDDSYNIQTALDKAVTAGPGSTIQLARGTFYLKEGIEIEGFDGFFRGSGKGKTIITIHDQVAFNIPAGDWPALIKFRHGNTRISDLTIKISDPEPCNIDWLGNAFPTVIMITGSNDENPGTADQTAGFTFNNVQFIGGNGNLASYNVLYFVLASWDGSMLYSLNGGCKITNCEFQKAYNCLVTAYTGGPCIIGGDAKSGNRFKDAEVGAGALDITSSYCKITDNYFEKIHWVAIMPWQGTIPDPGTLPLTKFIISENDINLSSTIPGEVGFTAGVELVDYGIFASTCEEHKVDAVITNNRIHINDIGFGGIIGECCSKVIVANNIISGKGSLGIGAGLFPIQDGSKYEPDEGFVIKGNNLQGMDATVAPLWLGPGTSNFLVFADKKDVLDEGTGNILIGSHQKRSGHPDSEIRARMKMHHDRIKLYKHPGMK